MIFNPLLSSLCLAFLSTKAVEMFIRTGSGINIRIINIAKIRRTLSNRLPRSSCKSIDDLYSALVGVHSFIGCDPVSSFSGKALKLLMKNDNYFDLFADFGTDWRASSENIKSLERVYLSDIWTT